MKSEQISKKSRTMKISSSYYHNKLLRFTVWYHNSQFTGKRLLIVRIFPIFLSLHLFFLVLISPCCHTRTDYLFIDFSIQMIFAFSVTLLLTANKHYVLLFRLIFQFVTEPKLNAKKRIEMKFLETGN